MKTFEQYNRINKEMEDIRNNSNAMCNFLNKVYKLLLELKEKGILDEDLEYREIKHVYNEKMMGIKVISNKFNKFTGMGVNLFDIRISVSNNRRNIFSIKKGKNSIMEKDKNFIILGLVSDYIIEKLDRFIKERKFSYIELENIIDIETFDKIELKVGELKVYLDSNKFNL